MPVLPIDEVPEVDGIRRVEVGSGDLVGMEQEVAVDARPAGRERPQRERGDVIARQAQHHVRVDELPLVPRPLVLAEAGERRAPRGAAPGERGRTRPVRDPRVPVEPAAAVLERGDHLAQLRVHGATVVALVVVLDDHLPVGEDLVGDASRHAELLQRIVPRSFRDGPEPVHQGSARCQVDEHEAAPRLDRRRVERELLLPEAVVLAQERCDPELAVEPVRPRVIRTPDRALESSVRDGGIGLPRRGLEDQPGAPMTAHVMEGTKPAVSIADDQQPLAGDVEVQVVAGGTQRLRPADEEPLAVEERLRLALEPGRGAVRVPREGSHRAGRAVRFGPHRVRPMVIAAWRRLPAGISPRSVARKDVR